MQNLLLVLVVKPLFSRESFIFSENLLFSCLYYSFTYVYMCSCVCVFAYTSVCACVYIKLTNERFHVNKQKKLLSLCCNRVIIQKSLFGRKRILSLEFTYKLMVKCSSPKRRIKYKYLAYLYKIFAQYKK